jgi:uncharacterized RDD family membrane protein YckC
MELNAEYRVETPENVEVSFELAGPGSRFCALMIDMLLMWLLIFLLFIATCIVDSSVLDEFAETDHSSSDHEVSAWGVALVILFLSLLVFGYSAFFEIVMRGQTPGKRSLKLRVLRDDGTPATALDICVRNIVRLVDFLPGFYVVGGLTCLLSATNKRLGDMAAGTIVVKEAPLDYRAQADKKVAPVVDEVPISNAALTGPEQRLIRGFLQRRGELLPDARAALAERLARDLHAKHGGEYGSAESYLERLCEGRHYEP